MNIVHFTLGSVSPDSSNGINRVIEGLARYTNHQSLADVSVLTVKKDLGATEKRRIEREGFSVTAFNSVSRAARHLREIQKDVDLVHLHNAWSWQNYRIGRLLISLGKPYVITPHAAFLPDRMQEKWILKRVFHFIFQKKLLNHAAFLHAVSREEMTSISRFTSNLRIEFVPNGSEKPHLVTRRERDRSSKLKIGFMGRLSREKNIIGLIRAIGMLPEAVRDTVALVIYGDNNTEYGRSCRAEVERLQLGSLVSFGGLVGGADKWNRLSELDIYIQPSFSEAASIAILEAMSVGLPVIATRTSCVSYWHGYEFLKMVEPVPLDIAKGIESWAIQKEDLKSKGRAARAYFAENLCWEVIAREMVAVYRAALVPGGIVRR